VLAGCGGYASAFLNEVSLDERLLAALLGSDVVQLLAIGFTWHLDIGVEFWN